MRITTEQEFNVSLGANAAADEYAERMKADGWQVEDGVFLPSLNTIGGVRVRMYVDVASPEVAGDSTSWTPIERWLVDKTQDLLADKLTREMVATAEATAEAVRLHIVRVVQRRARREEYGAVSSGPIVVTADQPPIGRGRPDPVGGVR